MAKEWKGKGKHKTGQKGKVHQKKGTGRNPCGSASPYIQKTKKGELCGYHMDSDQFLFFGTMPLRNKDKTRGAVRNPAQEEHWAEAFPNA